ncbi:hypothetical protein TOPH_01767 [Tolypocladium ophioglossoides CBS 100239]|uniref:Rhodopsin domain-containing protein n=1 Tax=Tolypocladium ophioglossoides (strain CBS 100239) TaxID=1163406 RepID=A0A0L0NHD6_TOLOC|nr:hypothetical protein TOPH_01767 [Tolypocladium ophioglossoides CBS 100239]
MAGQAIDLSENISSSLVDTCISLLVLSWVAVGLRTYTRAVLMNNFQADDWLMLVAQSIFTISCAFILEGVTRGLGRHNEAVLTDDDRVAALMVCIGLIEHPSPPATLTLGQWQAIATATYILDMMFIKLSIGIFLLRLSVDNVYKWILRVSLVVIALWSMGVFFWDVFQCTPVEKQWDFRIQYGHCASAGEVISAAYAVSVMTVLSDWLYALLPIPMLWNVKMTKQAKATVIVILGLGIFASVATLIRLKFLAGLEEANDLMFAATDAMVWTLVEPGVAIVASSLATIRPLLRAMKVRGFQSTDRTPSTGISTGGRHAHNGRATTARGSMPGYGSNDISLHLVGYGAEPREQDFPAKHVGLKFDEYHKQAAIGHHRADGGRQSNGKSKIYVIEGSKNSPTWSTQDLHPTNRSLNDFHDGEEQSQENGHVGLGASSRRR